MTLRLQAAAAATGPAIIITGGSSGIGLATAQLFTAKGWRVGIIARGHPGLRAAHGSLGAAAAAADVTDPAALEDAAAFLEAGLGPIAVWVNCAGNGVYGSFLDVPEHEFRRVTDVTYIGTVNGTRVALRRMVPRGSGTVVPRGSGTVINVCSAIAFHGLPMLSSYSGAKSAVRGFTDSVRHELIGAGSRVRLTTIFPPAVNTPFFSHAASHMPHSPRPAKPVYQPEIVADAVLLAATTDRREIQVGGITAVFALACKLVPGLVHHAIQRLGPEGQMTRCPEASRLRDPTLFAPSATASGSHGPFDAESRGTSIQMWANRHRGTLATAAGLTAIVLALARWRW